MTGAIVGAFTVCVLGHSRLRPDSCELREQGQQGGIVGFELVQDVAESVGAGGVGNAHEGAGFIDRRSRRGASERSLTGALPGASPVPEEEVEATVVDLLAEQVEREDPPCSGVIQSTEPTRH